MKVTEENKKKYQKLTQEVSPNSKIGVNCLRAFFVGGTICTIGQIINQMILDYGVSKDVASTYTSIALIFLSVFLTSLGLYEKIGRWAGAGSIVPITGFANAMCSPALEFKKEGMILGLGAKMFVIAGPVLVYGISTSFVVGLIYYFVK